MVVPIELVRRLQARCRRRHHRANQPRLQRKPLLVKVVQQWVRRRRSHLVHLSHLRSHLARLTTRTHHSLIHERHCLEKVNRLCDPALQQASYPTSSRDVVHQDHLPVHQCHLLVHRGHLPAHPSRHPPQELHPHIHEIHHPDRKVRSLAPRRDHESTRVGTRRPNRIMLIYGI